jgi:hypothetical protein
MAWNNYWNKSGGDSLQSKYNAASFKIARINEGIIRAKRLFRTGDLIHMNFELDMIWVELEADAKPEERSAMQQFMIEYRKLLKNLADCKKLSVNREIKTQVSDLLQQKFMFLFHVQKGQRLDKAYVEKDEDLF